MVFKSPIVEWHFIYILIAMVTMSRITSPVDARLIFHTVSRKIADLFYDIRPSTKINTAQTKSKF